MVAVEVEVAMEGAISGTKVPRNPTPDLLTAPTALDPPVRVPALWLQLLSQVWLRGGGGVAIRQRMARVPAERALHAKKCFSLYSKGTTCHKFANTA